MTDKVQKGTKQGRSEVKKEAVIEGVLSGKTEQQMADELGVNRSCVAKIKAKPEVRKRIQERVADRYSLTDSEVIGTLVAQMRADVTDLFDKNGGFDVQSIRKKRLGHLVRKIKVKRYFEGEGENKEPVDVIELEMHNQQSAAVQLCKVLGIEKLPQPSDTEKWEAIAAELAKQYDKPIEQVKRDLAAKKPELASVLIQ